MMPLRPGDLYQPRLNAEIRLVIGVSDSTDDYHRVTFVTTSGAVGDDTHPGHGVILLIARAH